MEYSEDALNFDATEFWPASLVQQLPSQSLGGLFPRITMDQFATLSRGTAPNRNRNYTVQPNVSLTRGAHNIRSGLDIRSTNVFNENYDDSGGFSTSTGGSRAARSRARRPSRATPSHRSFWARRPTESVNCQSEAALPVALRGAWIQDDWRVNNKLTLNLGFRWDINGSVTEENNMLNYVFDPSVVNPVSTRVGRPVMGAIRFVGVNGAPDRPWKLDKNNYQFRVGGAYSMNEKTVLRGGYGKYFLNPTAQGTNAGFSQGTGCHRVAGR